jgi:hypothetical protein
MSAEERNQIFRERLVALIADLHAGTAKDKQLRRRVGIIADRIVREAGTRDWSDLKERADGPTYDSLLELFQRQSAELQKADDSIGVKAFEVMAISLIARRQYQADLAAGVTTLDKWIGECLVHARRAGAQFIPAARTGRTRR